MKKTFATVMIAAFAGSLGAAQAQVVVPPGQDFYGTPTAHDMPMTMPPGKIVTAAAPAPKAKRMKMKMKKKKM